MKEEWLPVSTDLKVGDYRVLFEGGGEGIAALTPRGWIMIEDTLNRDANAGIVGYKKYYNKKKAEKISPFLLQPMPKK